MPRDYYPTGVELGVRLVAAGVLSNPPVSPQECLDLDAAMNAAAQAWEGLVGYTPFLAEAQNSTRYFDGDGSCIVDLKGGYVSITSVSLNGTGRTANTDYRAMPLNAVADGKPITYLKWGGGYGRPFPSSAGYAGPVAVTGKRGAYAVLPQLATEAIFAIGIDSLLGTSEFSQFGGLKRWTIGTDEREYDLEAYGRLSEKCQATIANALRRYRRVKVG